MWLKSIQCLALVVLMGAPGLAQSQAGHQNKSQIQSLPSSRSRSSTETSSRTQTDRSTSFYRQAQEDRYPYPATSRPRYVGNTVYQPNVGTTGQFQNRQIAGNQVSTGNLRDAADRRLNVSVASTLDNTKASSDGSTGERFASAQPTWGTRPSGNSTPARQVGATSARQQVYQVPYYRTAQNCNCGPGVVPNFALSPQAANQAPALNPNVGAGLATAPAAQPGTVPYPAAGYGQPYCVPNGYAGYGYNGVGGSLFRGNGPGSANWWTPLVPLVGPKPGTYLGQGIIGQPTAYVDGEPLRNLLRYIAP